MKVEGVQQVDGGVRGMDGDVLRDVEQRLGVVEQDLHAGVDQVIRRLLGVLGRDREDADDDVLLANGLLEARRSR